MFASRALALARDQRLDPVGVLVAIISLGVVGDVLSLDEVCGPSQRRRLFLRMVDDPH